METYSDEPNMAAYQNSKPAGSIFSVLNMFPTVNSRIVQPLSTSLGLEADKLIFLFCILMSIVFGVIMSTLLSPKWTSPTIRHLYSGTIGFIMILLCYGAGTVHLVALSTASYLMLLFVPPNKVQTYLFFFCMLYLSIMHIIRMSTDYGAYNLDVTTPMMIMVSKMSALGFSLYDGMGKTPDKVRPQHEETKITRIPTIIEFFGYGFSFLTSFAGPFCFFNEYDNFIHGRALRREFTKDVQNMPHPLVSAGPNIGKKAIECVISATLYMYLSSRFDMRTVLTPQWFYINPIWFQVAYIIIVGIVERCKYYVAFLLVDIGCNAAGLGFRGLDPETGKARWDGVVNVRIRDIEFGSNLRTVLNGWNIGIVTWLRFVVYDRVKFAPVTMTYFYSALWHGFYPGYYIAFITCGLFISVARWGRRKVRPYFLDDGAAKFAYDVFTFVLTRIALAYCSPAFILLDGLSTFTFYWSVYFIGHIVGAAAYGLLPLLPSSPKAAEGKRGDGDGEHHEGERKPARPTTGAGTPSSPAAGSRVPSSPMRDNAVRNRTAPRQRTEM